MQREARQGSRIDLIDLSSRCELENESHDRCLRWRASHLRRLITG